MPVVSVSWRAVFAPLLWSSRRSSYWILVAATAATCTQEAAAIGAPSADARAAAPIPAPGFHLLDDADFAAHAFIDKQNRITLAVVATSVIGAHQLDPAARDFFNRQRRLGDADRLGNDVLGTGVPGLLLAGGFWVWGAAANSGYEVHAGQAQLEAIVATSLAGIVIKGTARRDRPDGSDQNSFPSAHTSTVAASAMSLQEFYGWKAGVPMFALTALTAASRMSVDAHWFSDTVAGAGLGILVGHAFSRAHLDRIENKASPIAVTGLSRPVFWPWISPGGAELAMALSY